jgi:hypothetical protein
MNTDSKNPPKIFISHSTDNAKIASALVGLLEFLGIRDIFCSSVSGYEVLAGESIYQRIKSEYENHNLFMIYLISSAYLDSPMSLNEMGAAWVLKNDYQTFILPNLNVNSLDGTCIGKNSIAIRWDDNNIKARMNQFKAKIIKLFDRSAPDESRWEDRRDEFIKKFQSYQPAPEDKKQTISIEKPENQPDVRKEPVNNLVTLDSPFKDEYHLKSYINKTYEQLSQFEKGQLEIERIRLDTSNNERITPTSSIAKDVWADGYRVVSYVNNLILNLQGSDKEEYLAEARAIKAFVYYNMAMLWGNIPIEKFVDPNNSDVQSSQSKAEDVYSYCLNLLKKCSSIKSLDNGRVTDSFVNILYTELYLSLGQKDLAYSHLKKVSSFNDSIFTLNVLDINKTKSMIDIYTQKYVELLKEEIEGKDNSNIWFGRGAIYGTWAALKRLGQAQSLTGIKDYELFLPIPQPKIDCFPHNIKQNSGY